ncbi:hypothetical protein Tco_1438016 [Tanacetum coccineum]
MQRNVIPGRVLVPPGSVVVPPGSVVTTGSVLVSPGSVVVPTSPPVRKALSSRLRLQHLKKVWVQRKDSNISFRIGLDEEVVSAKTTYKLFSMLNAPWSTCDQKFKVRIVSPDRSIHNTSAHNSVIPGRVLVPPGSVVVPPGSVVVPTGSVVVPPGSVVVPTGSVNLFSKSDPTIMTH